MSVQLDRLRSALNAQREHNERLQSRLEVVQRAVATQFSFLAIVFSLINPSWT